MSSQIRGGGRGQKMAIEEPSGWRRNRPNSVTNVIIDSAQTHDFKQEFVNQRCGEKEMPVALVTDHFAFNAINEMSELNGSVGECKMQIMDTSIDWFCAESLELMQSFGYKDFLRSGLPHRHLMLKSLYPVFDIRKHMKRFKCFKTCFKQLADQFDQATINQFVVKRATKRRLFKERVPTIKQIIVTKECNGLHSNIKINYKNEELSKQIYIRDQLIKPLTQRILKELPIKLRTKYILVGTYLLTNYKIIMSKESIRYYTKVENRSFLVLHSSIEELIFCLDKSHPLMIIKYDGAVSDKIRERIQLEIYNPNIGWYDSESEDSSETYIICRFPDNSTKIWDRMALILLLYEYNPKLINKIEAQLIVNRAHPIQP